MAMVSKYLGFVHIEVYAQDKAGFLRAMMLKLILKHEKLEVSAERCRLSSLNLLMSKEL